MDPLLEVRQLQKEGAVRLKATQRVHFAIALAKALKNKGPEYQRQAIRLAKEMFQEGGTTVIDSISRDGLFAILAVCASGDEPEALEWAQTTWALARWKDMRHYNPYIRVLERHQLYRSSDELLAKVGHEIDVRQFNGLLDIAAEKYSYRRADALWTRFVDQLGVAPNGNSYHAWAKAHLLCGRPSTSARIFYAMLTAHPRFTKGRSLLEFSQALLIQSHSSMALNDIRWLKSALEKGDEVIGADSGSDIQRQWRDVKAAAARLFSNPVSLRLHDVLIEDKAKRRSVMKDWPNHEAGTEYLDA